MDILGLLTDQLQRANPLLLPLIIPASILTKGIVSGVKVVVNWNKTWDEKLKGNIVQTLAAAVALGVSAVEGASVGLFSTGVTPSAAVAWLILSIIIWIGAMGTHSLVTNQNRPAPLPGELPEGSNEL